MADDDDRDGFDRLGDRANTFAERQAGKFADKPKATSARWIVGIVGTILMLVVIGGIISFASGWGGEAKRVISVPNAREQTTVILGDQRALVAAAGNVCDVRDTPPDPNSPTLVEDPALAYRATYRNTKADYDRRMSNFFEAAEVRKLPVPDALSGLPKEAPSLSQMMARVC